MGTQEAEVGTDTMPSLMGRMQGSVSMRKSESKSSLLAHSIIHP